jgi:hypothetical protein
MRIDAKVSALGRVGPVAKVWVVTYVSDKYADHFGSLIFGTEESAVAVAKSMEEEEGKDEFYVNITCHEIEIRG